MRFDHTRVASHAKQNLKRRRLAAHREARCCHAISDVASSQVMRPLFSALFISFCAIPTLGSAVNGVGIAAYSLLSA